MVNPSTGTEIVKWSVTSSAVSLKDNKNNTCTVTYVSDADDIELTATASDVASNKNIKSLEHLPIKLLFNNQDKTTLVQNNEGVTTFNLTSTSDDVDTSNITYELANNIKGVKIENKALVIDAIFEQESVSLNIVCTNNNGLNTTKTIILKKPELKDFRIDSSNLILGIEKEFNISPVPLNAFLNSSFKITTSIASSSTTKINLRLEDYVAKLVLKAKCRNIEKDFDINVDYQKLESITLDNTTTTTLGVNNYVIVNATTVPDKYISPISWVYNSSNVEATLSNNNKTIKLSYLSTKDKGTFDLYASCSGKETSRKTIITREVIDQLKMTMTDTALTTDRKGYQLFEDSKIKFEYSANPSAKIYYKICDSEDCDAVDTTCNVYNDTEMVDFPSPFDVTDRIKDDSVKYESYKYASGNKYKVIKVKAIWNNKESKEFVRRIYKVKKQNIYSDDNYEMIKDSNSYSNGEDINDIGLADNKKPNFYYQFDFNGNISYWDVSSCKDLSTTFSNNQNFNQDLSRWDTSKVTDMNNMFYNCLKFNQDISNWDTSKVTNMSAMFNNCIKFNQDLSRWDTSKVTDMCFMFKGAKLFNEDISNWDISKVVDFREMFLNASSFNQNLHNWIIKKSYAIKYTRDKKMFEGTPIEHNSEKLPQFID